MEGSQGVDTGPKSPGPTVRTVAGEELVVGDPGGGVTVDPGPVRTDNAREVKMNVYRVRSGPK